MLKKKKKKNLIFVKLQLATSSDYKSLFNKIKMDTNNKKNP